MEYEKPKTLSQLEAENAKLRDLMYERAHRHAIQHMTEDELRIVATNALDENAKLRELVRDMWALQIALPYGAHFETRDRMRELGIEVEDGN